MPGNKPHILCTRPISDDMVTKANANDIVITIIPFIKTVELPVDNITAKVSKLNSGSVIVFTSVNAVNAVAGINAKLQCKVYCISGATAKAVNSLLPACTVVTTADSAKKLASRVLENDTITGLTFFCGDHYIPDLPQILRDNKVITDIQIVYKTELTPVVIKGEYDGIVFFSPTAVKSFFSLNSVNETCQLFAIGNTTAESLNYLKNKVAISHTPDTGVMIDTIIDFYKRAFPVK